MQKHIKFNEKKAKIFFFSIFFSPAIFVEFHLFVLYRALPVIKSMPLETNVFQRNAFSTQQDFTRFVLPNIFMKTIICISNMKDAPFSNYIFCFFVMVLCRHATGSFALLVVIATWRNSGLQTCNAFQRLHFRLIEPSNFFSWTHSLCFLSSCRQTA